MHSLFTMIHLVKAFVAGMDDWYTGMKMKKRLERQVGRKVTNHELVSIRAWMSDEPTSGKK
jgi:hypothetical protein